MAFKKKAAEVMTYIIASVILLISLFIIFPYVSNIYAVSEGVASQTLCVKSLDSAQNARLFGGRLSARSGESLDLKCYTDYRDLRETTNEELPRYIAEHMLDCFLLYGKRASLFDQELGTYCIVCKSFFSESEMKAEGIVDYIKNTAVPSSESGGSSYAKFFGSEVIPVGSESKYNNYVFQAKKSTDLIVVFGTKDFKGTRLTYNPLTGIGILLQPHDNLKDLGCYSFEGKSTTLEMIKFN